MTASDIEKKIAGYEVPSVNKVAVAYSGGLDSSLAIELLRRIYKAKEIVPITIDVGQGDEEIDLGNRKAEKLGIKPIVIDAKQEFCDDWLTKAIRANSDEANVPKQAKGR